MYEVTLRRVSLRISLLASSSLPLTSHGVGVQKLVPTLDRLFEVIGQPKIFGRKNFFRSGTGWRMAAEWTGGKVCGSLLDACVGAPGNIGAG